MNDHQSTPVALVTGAGARIGAAIARALHGAGYNILLHYNRSQEAALSLAMTLNAEREESAHCLQADLLDLEQVTDLAGESLAHWGRMDALVNNASSFFPTPLSRATNRDWNDLMGSNARAPFFLVQQLARALAQHRGCVVNISDIYARRALSGYSIYSMAKAALDSMTQAMARELAPEVRVNAVAPGAVLWPAGGAEVNSAQQQTIIAQTCLQRMGDPADVAHATRFLIEEAAYLTGQVISVDGGRSLRI